jgi:methylmalonyl-CoA/ethylmalonyl-CoA epimerase
VKLTQVAQHVDDLDRAVTFYKELLRSEPVAQFDPPGLAFFMMDGTRLLLDRGGPTALLYLEVDNVRDRVEELRRSGVSVESEPHVIFTHEDSTLGPAGTDEWMAFIRDSENNLVGLVSQLSDSFSPT